MSGSPDLARGAGPPDSGPAGVSSSPTLEPCDCCSAVWFAGGLTAAVPGPVCAGHLLQCDDDSKGAAQGCWWIFCPPKADHAEPCPFGCMDDPTEEPPKTRCLNQAIGCGADRERWVQQERQKTLQDRAAPPRGSEEWTLNCEPFPTKDYC